MKINDIKNGLLCCTLFAVFASAQIAYADGLANATINSTTGGFVGMENGINSATLNFDGNTHVNWNTLNLGQNETLNFNAINGVSGITVLNTVTGGQMSYIYGTINSNSGIGKLIISNPSGMLYDGAHFTTAGDLMLTTNQLVPTMNGNIMTGYTGIDTQAANGITIKDSDFNIGGNFNIVAPQITITDTLVTASKLKMTTANGQDFLVNNYNNLHKNFKTEMRAVEVDGDVVIISTKDTMKINKIAMGDRSTEPEAHSQIKNGIEQIKAMGDRSTEPGTHSQIKNGIEQIKAMGDRSTEPGTHSQIKNGIEQIEAMGDRSTEPETHSQIKNGIEQIKAMGDRFEQNNNVAGSNPLFDDKAAGDVLSQVAENQLYQEADKGGSSPLFDDKAAGDVLSQVAENQLYQEAAVPRAESHNKVRKAAQSIESSGCGPTSMDMDTKAPSVKDVGNMFAHDSYTIKRTR